MIEWMSFYSITNVVYSSRIRKVVPGTPRYVPEMGLILLSSFTVIEYDLSGRTIGY